MREEEETTEYFKIMYHKLVAEVAELVEEVAEMERRERMWREKMRKEKEETTRREKMWREEMRKEKREEKDSDHLNNEINDENRDPNHVYQAPGSRIIHHVRVMPGYLFLMHYWCQNKNIHKENLLLNILMI